MPSAFENMLSMFNKSAPAAPAAATPAGVPAQSGPAQGSNQPAFQQSGTLPPNTQAAPAPLAEYADIWNTAPVPEGAPQPSLDDPFLPVDAAKVKEFLATKNFVPQSQEAMALLQKGMQGDVGAMVDFLGQMAQSIAYDSALTNAHVAERVARTGVNRLKDTIPQHVRSLTSADALYSANPLMNNPAMKPMVEAMHAQFQQKNPTATAKQLAEMTSKFFQDQAALFNPQAASSQGQNPSHDPTDFSKF